MVKKNPEHQVVARYTRVETDLIDSAGESEKLSFTVVPDEQADFSSGLLGENTPLASAIMGKPAGSPASYYANGLIRVKILSVTPIDHPNMGEGAARRKAAVEEAITQAERTSALIFSTSVAGKWGDYDADGMIEGWEEGQKPSTKNAEKPSDKVAESSEDPGKDS
jgi:hypothetical protein